MAAESAHGRQPHAGVQLTHLAFLGTRPRPNLVAEAADAGSRSVPSVERSVVDKGVLRQLLDDFSGDVAVLHDIVGSYLDDFPREMDRVRMAAAARDASSLRLAAHTLKSLTKTFGAGDFSAHAGALEEEAKAPRWDVVESMIEELTRRSPALLAQTGRHLAEIMRDCGARS